MLSFGTDSFAFKHNRAARSSLPIDLPHNCALNLFFFFNHWRNLIGTHGAFPLPVFQKVIQEPARTGLEKRQNDVDPVLHEHL